jgi:hypothetical protein
MGRDGTLLNDGKGSFQVGDLVGVYAVFRLEYERLPRVKRIFREIDFLNAHQFFLACGEDMRRQDVVVNGTLSCLSPGSFFYLNA